MVLVFLLLIIIISICYLAMNRILEFFDGWLNKNRLQKNLIKN